MTGGAQTLPDDDTGPLPAYWDVCGGDHRGHRHHRRYEPLLRAKLVAARPWVDAATRAGWTNLLVAPELDCETAGSSDSTDVVELRADLTCPPLNPMRAYVRIVTGRPATIRDMHMLLGGGKLHEAVVYLLVADELEEDLAARNAAGMLYPGLTIGSAHDLGLHLTTDS